MHCGIVFWISYCPSRQYIAKSGNIASLGNRPGLVMSCACIYDITFLAAPNSSIKRKRNEKTMCKISCNFVFCHLFHNSNHRGIRQNWTNPPPPPHKNREWCFLSFINNSPMSRYFSYTDWFLCVCLNIIKKLVSLTLWAVVGFFSAFLVTNHFLVTGVGKFIQEFNYFLLTRSSLFIDLLFVPYTVKTVFRD